MSLCVADIAEKARLVAAATPMSALVALMREDSSCEWLTVVEARKPVGLLSRAAIMEMSATSTPGALTVLTAGELVPADPYRIRGDLPVAEIALTHQDDGYARLRGGAMVTKGRKYLGVVTLPNLLKAVAQENAAQAQAMQGTPAIAREPDDINAASDPLPETPTMVETTQYLLAKLAHEVRTPLTGMMGLAEMLASRIQDSEHRDIAETIVRSGGTLDRILRDTLDYVSLESGKQQIKPEAADLTELVTELRQLWSAQSARRGLSLRVGFTPGGPHRVSVDLGRVRQVLNNLISNALKFTPEGGVTVDVSAIPSGENYQLCVEVADTGRGLSETDKARLFKAFETGAKSQAGPGWGLGLTISQSLARHLGGELTVSDNPGGGAIFRLTVPVEDCAAPASTQAPVLKSGRFALGKVLVVEDHEPCAMVVTSALETAGWQVEQVATLSGAHAALNMEEYQAILTDLNLIDGSALSLIHDIRQRGGANSDIPVLTLTAEISQQAQQACLAMGADRALRKPINGPLLVATLADVLMHRAAGHTTVTQLRGRMAG